MKINPLGDNPQKVGDLRETLKPTFTFQQIVDMPNVQALLLEEARSYVVAAQIATFLEAYFADMPAGTVFYIGTSRVKNGSLRISVNKRKADNLSKGVMLEDKREETQGPSPHRGNAQRILSSPIPFRRENLHPCLFR
jgi:hypothetical protein